MDLAGSEIDYSGKRENRNRDRHEQNETAASYDEAGKRVQGCDSSSRCSTSPDRELLAAEGSIGDTPIDFDLLQQQLGG